MDEQAHNQVDAPRGSARVRAYLRPGHALQRLSHRGRSLWVPALPSHACLLCGNPVALSASIAGCKPSVPPHWVRPGLGRGDAARLWTPAAEQATNPAGGKVASVVSSYAAEGLAGGKVG